MAREGWTVATPEKCCPICGRDHYCTIGRVNVLCTAVESTKPEPKGNGWFHRLPEDLRTPIAAIPRKQKERRATDAELHAKWYPLLLSARENGGEQVKTLAAELGVAPWALDALRFAWDGRQYVIPTMNARGQIIGLDTRWKDGTKRVVPGSHRGLVYAENWQDYPGPIIVVEGPSDVGAALTLYLAVVGRPNNIGGVESLVRLLGPLRRPVLVIAERDRKRHDDLPEIVRKTHDPACQGCLRCWPGLGAKKTADALWQRGIKAGWSLLPGKAKDTRSWLRSQPIDVNCEQVCRRVGQSLLRTLRPGKIPKGEEVM